MKATWALLPILLSACGSPESDQGPDAQAERTVTIAMSSFTLPPGGEVTKCQWFANPLGGDVEVRGFESHMSTGVHHMLVTAADGQLTDAPLRDCRSGVTEKEIILYGSQAPENRVEFPAGVAAVMTPAQGMRIQTHVFNASDSPMTINVEVILRLAEPGTTTAHAGVVMFGNQTLTIPSGPMPTTITKTCTVPADMNFVAVTSHMHRHGVEFTADVDGQPLFHNTEWAEPPMKFFDPPLALSAGQHITFSCTYKNETGETIMFGQSAETDEMCQLSTRLYPMPKLEFGSFACL